MKKHVALLLVSASLLSACAQHNQAELHSLEGRSAAREAAIESLEESLRQQSGEELPSETPVAEPIMQEVPAATAVDDAEADEQLLDVGEPSEPVDSENWPDPPYPLGNAYEWATYGPFDNELACDQESDAFDEVSVCFAMPDGWYFYAVAYSRAN